ncbi:MAG TPA: folate-binding protein, partial [Burkholderiales bacterium]|nr:folate-binding protein [Burkholderiales bacterium]
MNSHWQDHLRARSVVIDDGRVTSFGHPGAEMQALRSGTVLCDLSHLGAIRVSGEDALSFLQGQLTCDVRQVNATAARYGGYCSPKGRLLATFLLWQSAGAFHMQLPQALREPIRKRLSMFVLRARVRLDDASDDPVRMGISGPAAEAALAQCLGPVPQEPLGLRERDGVVLIRLDAQRFEAVAPPERAPQLWDALARHATPGGAGCWDWLDVRAGITTVLPTTQDQFIPQMANLDLIGGVSYDKGCYTGQEIVARTHYL